MSYIWHENSGPCSDVSRNVLIDTSGMWHYWTSVHTWWTDPKLVVHDPLSSGIHGLYKPLFLWVRPRTCFWQDMAKATAWQSHDCAPLYQITLLVVDSHVCFSAAFIEARKLCHSFTILSASLSLNSCGYSFRSLLCLPLTSFLASGSVPICVNLTFHL